MINLSKIFTGAVFALAMAARGFAGEAILFDDPSLIAYRDDGRIYGLYDAQNEKFSCNFLFFEKSDGTSNSVIDGYTDTKLLTFIPDGDSFEFSNRDRDFDIDGDLYRREDEWIIRTSSGQAGCENSAGGFIFKLGSMEAIKYHIARKFSSSGIRIVRSKTLLYDRRGKEFFTRRGYLAKWNAVVVLESQKQYSLIRFSDPRLNVESYGRVTTGWVHTSDLVNPLPPEAKH
ncbi:hypothetical protein WJ542_23210 [Paraburkholderia sp. B3]|uniref:hypothetical protein n=1 Tax=Paraburkholderia sp. B3 TaxID=3134791 RepID=UPI0039829206